MADGVLSFPPRLTAQGQFATAAHGSDQEVEELLAVMALTATGERPLQPDYGITDPTYGGISINDLETGVEEFGPEGVQITNLVEQVQSSTVSLYDIQWTRDAVENDEV